MSLWSNFVPSLLTWTVSSSDLLSLHFKELIALINSNRVVVVSGETGCGKTTQVTQFILDDHISRGLGSICRVVCTQPRRISAISVCFSFYRLSLNGIEIRCQLRFGFFCSFQKNKPNFTFAFPLRWQSAWQRSGQKVLEMETPVVIRSACRGKDVVLNCQAKIHSDFLCF